MGMADPDVGLGYGYVTSQMGATFAGDPRDAVLRAAIYSSLQAQPDTRPAQQPPSGTAAG